MNKIIWMIWWQGRDAAPEVVRRCISSWEERNPEWAVKCLDAMTIRHYLELSDWVDLNSQNLTAASLSDVARVALLHEFGGVWVDATTVCNIPLDDWLHEVVQEGFFAFELHPFPQGDRPISSWFLAAEANNKLFARWAARVYSYWRFRKATDDYFWLHHLFYEMLEQDEVAAQDWARVPRVSAKGPHSAQFEAGLESQWEHAVSKVDWTAPLYKLTYRCNPKAMEAGSLLSHLLECYDPDKGKREGNDKLAGKGSECALLSVSTHNRGDHVQIIAARKLMERVGLKVKYHLDRDDEIRSAPNLSEEASKLPILMSGWHKTNGQEWPPNESLLPIFLGFHIRLFQCPELLSDQAVRYYKRYGPIGCRDIHTQSLLESRGVEAFLSHCLSLVFSKRFETNSPISEVFVVSRDERILDSIPRDLGPVTFVNHYTETTNFDDNLNSTIKLLHQYRSKAKLIITTLLHCALPAMAMGIPVVMFYPHNSEKGHASDLERLSSLARMVRVYNFDNLAEVDWRGHVVDVSRHKLMLIESFLKLSDRWEGRKSIPIGPISEANILPPPTQNIWMQRRGGTKA